MLGKNYPIQDNEVIKKFYYKNSVNLSIRLSSWKTYGTNKQTLNDWIWSLINPDPAAHKFAYSILDVGCGTGEMLASFKKCQKNLSTYGVDISAAMIKRAAHKNRWAKQNFILSDAAILPFKTSSFHITTAIFVLHHVANRLGVIRELVRVTKKNGIIIVADGDYNVRNGLNAVHYAAIRKLHFPGFMNDSMTYLASSKKHIGDALNRLRLKNDGHIYKNRMVFHKVSPVLRYYASAMMYRNSSGPKDKRISPELWQKLFNEVKNMVHSQIRRGGKFEIPGNVYCYLIHKG